MPRYRIRSDGDLVRFNDHFMLYNTKLRSFLEVDQKSALIKPLLPVMTISDIRFRRSISKLTTLRSVGLYSSSTSFGWRLFTVKKGSSKTA